MFCVCLKYLGNEDECKDAVSAIAEKLIVEINKHEIVNFKPWLHVVVKNYCLMKIRSSKSSGRKVELYEKDMPVFMEIENDQHLVEADLTDEKIKLMETGLENLNVEQKICVKMFYLDDLSYTDIAEKTGYSLNQVKSYIQNGKRNLKIYITEKLVNNKLVIIVIVILHQAEVILKNIAS